jgi:8-oxo-dGTP pyrophosphatase MutT (NUDIX family)
VAAAVIRDASGKILIARRADTQHQGGLWEFPGGKVEPGEAVEAALARELQEELGIVVTAARPRRSAVSLTAPKGNLWPGSLLVSWPTMSSPRPISRLSLPRVCQPNT